MQNKQSKKSTAKTVRPHRKRVVGARWHEAIIVDYHKLLAWPNVERVALGWKERKGKVSSKFSVKIYVPEKKKPNKLNKKDALPQWTNILLPVGNGLYKTVRVPTDVVWHKPVQFCAAPGDYLNPIGGGAFLGVPGGNVGTYACMVQDQSGQPFALTAGHIVQPFVGAIPKGTAIIQPPTPPPGPPPPGSSPLLGRTVTGFFGNEPGGFVDCALLQLDSARAGISTALDGLNSNRQVLPYEYVVNNHIQVTKFGAITGRTGAVVAGRVPLIVIGGVTVTEVYECIGLAGPIFGQQGDSGALVLSTSPGSQACVVGLLFACMPATPDAPTGRGYVFPFERIVGFRPV